MKNVLTALACLLSVSLSAQTDLIYDGNGDGCVTIDDVLGLLIEYGQCLDVEEEFMCGDNINHEGYNYSTVQIGNQCWFSENCRYLPLVSPSAESSGDETSPHYYVYGYEGTDVAAAQTTDNYATYGVLYNWPAVMTEGICPSGWHIPSDGEFTELTDFLGGESVAGYAMKSTSGWNNDGNGSNSSGFNGLPGGYQHPPNGFGGIEAAVSFWSASEAEVGPISSWRRFLYNSSDVVIRSAANLYNGYSARCVIDYTDECGVINGDNSTCLDECGVINGDNSTCLDECGVINGDNSTCLDECGVPNGDNSTCFTTCGDDIEHDAYDYSTVLIGDQCWFSENCRYLPEVSPSSESSLTSPYYYVYDYQGTDIEDAKSTDNYETYGVLYNWPAVMTEGICPSGWHIPTDLEWQTMEMALGLSASEASSQTWRGTHAPQMKSTSGWNNNGNGTNSSGLTILPGGFKVDIPIGFTNYGDYAHLWSASEDASSYSFGRVLYGSVDTVWRSSFTKQFGFSARCVQD
jgi:uncharacterized protein (TIGR02145 family)